MSKENRNIISVRNIGKAFWTRKKEWLIALKEINFVVDEGSFVSIIGPSGCGKSTLLKIIAGLIPPSSGECYGMVVLSGSRARTWDSFFKIRCSYPGTLS